MSTSSFLSNGKRHLMLRNSNPLPPPPPIKLSHVLSTIPNFSFFDELINLPQPLTSNPSESFNLLQRDVFQITKVLEDINLYLNDLLMIFNNVEQASKMLLMYWIGILKGNPCYKTYYEILKILIPLYPNCY